MTAAEKAALEWLDIVVDGNRAIFGAEDKRTKAALTITAMLAQPRLPKEPSDDLLLRMRDGGTTFEVDGTGLSQMRSVYRALYAHLTRPHVDYAALDEARMDDSSDAGASPRTSTAKQAELRKAISVLRGWSAEAAGRTGLAESVLIVCNAAESTLPVQMYRVRNGAALDVICPGPISISEVDNA